VIADAALVSARGRTWWTFTIPGVQVFPVGLGRIHPGLFVLAGVASGETRGESFGGNAFGGELIVEVALTTRLALTLRAGHTLAQYINREEGWGSVSTFSSGFAIY
jgi:hypothetical protein